MIKDSAPANANNEEPFPGSMLHIAFNFLEHDNPVRLTTQIIPLIRYQLSAQRAVVSTSGLENKAKGTWGLGDCRSPPCGFYGDWFERARESGKHEQDGSRELGVIHLPCSKKYPSRIAIVISKPPNLLRANLPGSPHVTCHHAHKAFGPPLICKTELPSQAPDT